MTLLQQWVTENMVSCNDASFVKPLYFSVEST